MFIRVVCVQHCGLSSFNSWIKPNITWNIEQISSKIYCPYNDNTPNWRVKIVFCKCPYFSTVCTFVLAWFYAKYRRASKYKSTEFAELYSISQSKTKYC